MPGLFTRSRLCCFGPPFFSCAALILSTFANARCYLVSLDDDSSLRVGKIPEPDSVGLWCYEAVNGNNYEIRDDADFDDKFDAARALGTTTLALGLVVWVYYLFVPCVRFLRRPMFYKFVGFICICTCLFQGLVFLVFKSEDVCDGDDLGCSLDTGGNCAIAACVLWFFSGTMSFAVGKEEEEDAEDKD